MSSSWRVYDTNNERIRKDKRMDKKKISLKDIEECLNHILMDSMSNIQSGKGTEFDNFVVKTLSDEYDVVSCLEEEVRHKLIEWAHT